MSNKKKILLFTDWYEPGYKAGGPIRSCKNFASALQEDFFIRIITSDRDQGDEGPYQGITANTWTEAAGGVAVYYSSPGHLTLRKLKELINGLSPEFIYLNSMYSFRYTILPLLLKWRQGYPGKVVIAPRGMLQEGALRFKSFKKKLFIGLLNGTGLPREVIFQATDEQERKDILRHFPRAGRVILLPNITTSQKVEWQRVIKEAGELSCVFISRISPKKNILFLLETLRQAPAGIRIRLDLYGAIEDQEYWKKCLSAIEALATHITVRFMGAIPNEAVSEVLQQHHIFVLPTLGENFGHAIFEALLAGKPVLISDKTPWVELESKKIGYDICLEPALFRQALERLAGMDQQEYDDWSLSAFAYAAKFRSDDGLKGKYIELFQ